MGREVETYQIGFEKSIHGVFLTSCIATLLKARKK